MDIHIGLLCSVETDARVDFAHNDIVQALQREGAVMHRVYPDDFQEIVEKLRGLDGMVVPMQEQKEIGAWALCMEPFQGIPRDFEGQVLRYMVRSGKAILAMGGGMQRLNLALGGSLRPIQNRLRHQGHGGRHSVRIISDGWLRAAYGAQYLVVDSAHRRSIDRLGVDMRAAAVSPDGKIEAIEHFVHPIVGIQWQVDGLKSENKALFSAFIRACAALQRIGKPCKMNA